MRSAAVSLNEKGKFSVTKASSVYETKPYGYKDQENFLNAAVQIETDLNFFELLDNLKLIEKKLGRIERTKWGPREIDLDLLFYNNVIFSNEKITVPHKEVEHRDFVLIPLCEIAGDLIHPALNIKICDICIDSSEKCIIKKLPDKIL